MNGGGVVSGKSIISIANSTSSTRTLTAGNGGPVVKVSGSQSQIIQGPNGSVTLMVASSSSSCPSSNLIEAQSPNVSVPSSSGGGGKRVGPKGSSHNAKERRGEIPSVGGGGGGSSKEKETATGGTPVEADPPKDVITLKSDLRSIMHAFGDECMPLEESVNLMEILVRQEMRAFLSICDQAAELRGTNALGLRECVYAMKSDRSNLAKLFKYLTAKDQQQKTQRLNQVTQSIKFTVHTKSYLSEIKEILEEFEDFGQLGQLLDPEICMENSKTELGSRADRIHLRLINSKVFTYTKSRSVSFARKLCQLHEWTATHLHSEYKLTPTFIEVLSFLIYEMVAQIVDLAFIIKRERNGNTDHIQRLMDFRGINPDTCMSAPAFQKKRKDDECNSVSEILVQASELEAKRLKNGMLPTSKTQVRSVHCLSPCEIREAYLRLQRSPAPSSSYVSRAKRICQFNFQY